MADLENYSEHTVQDLKHCPSLWYKIHVFVYDLRHFKELVDSQARLESIVDASFIGTPYFQSDEIEYLKSTTVDGKPLRQIIQEVLDERLERRMKKRVESGDYRVCAAHDLAPIFEKAFGIKSKELAAHSQFQELLTAYGLGLPNDEEFDGLVKKNKKIKHRSIK